MKSTYNLFLLGTAFLLSSCIAENFDDAPAKEGKEIRFGLASPKTRTIYDSENTSQINWVSGDGITIYCDEAESIRKANYKVTPASQSHNGTIAAAGDSYLSWGSDSDTHNFFAVYPNNISVENGVAAFPINRNQKAIVTTPDGTQNNIVAVPDMTNAYMVATASTAPTDNPVIESKNGWLKKEMYIDFDINNYNTVQEFIDDIVYDNNYLRPSYALNYKTPIEYKIQLGFN